METDKNITTEWSENIKEKFQAFHQQNINKFWASLTEHQFSCHQKGADKLVDDPQEATKHLQRIKILFDGAADQGRLNKDGFVIFCRAQYGLLFQMYGGTFEADDELLTKWFAMIDNLTSGQGITWEDYLQQRKWRLQYAKEARIQETIIEDQKQIDILKQRYKEPIVGSTEKERQDKIDHPLMPKDIKDSSKDNPIQKPDNIQDPESSLALDTEDQIQKNE